LALVATENTNVTQGMRTASSSLGEQASKEIQELGARHKRLDTKLAEVRTPGEAIGALGEAVEVLGDLTAALNNIAESQRLAATAEAVASAANSARN
jgi:hypothetical protein